MTSYKDPLELYMGLLDCLNEKLGITKNEVYYFLIEARSVHVNTPLQLLNY
ncbi:hypothetical protein GT022_00905 [Agaribacter marinus]|uniref:Uncharacterized protein n=1 Tax=Virgibacillus salarius TaxID=447199 RepID=A0A941I7K0_9BACI|nr:hypothetical protein [Virgibacillus salarius]NAZ07321.1 hypothetical protein [Agaribacter marinus]